MASAQEEGDLWTSEVLEVSEEEAADASVEENEDNLDEESDVEEMLVLGIERSLQAALDEKRRRTNLTEGITD